jgi:hypothetical protein
MKARIIKSTWYGKIDVTDKPCENARLEYDDYHRTKQWFLDIETIADLLNIYSPLVISSPYMECKYDIEVEVYDDYRE